MDIQCHGFLSTESLREHVEHRFQFALTRFSDRIVRISVQLSDINGPRGGVDKRCLILVELRGLPALLVKDTETDLYVAIDRASKRVERALVRHLRRPDSLAIDQLAGW